MCLVRLGAQKEERKQKRPRGGAGGERLGDVLEASHGRDVRVLVINGRAVAAMERRSTDGSFKSNISLGGVGTAFEPPPEMAGLLGLYDGVPLTERGEFYAGVLPDRILVFRLPTLAICDRPEDVVEEVHITVVHEIAHHFGIDDDRLHELGYD